jgi:MscS family membrane protein
METLRAWLDTTLADPLWRVAFILAATLLATLVLHLLLRPLVRRAVRGTSWTLDDEILDMFWPAAARTVYLVGLRLLLQSLTGHPRVDFLVGAIITTLLVLIWGRTVNAAGTLVAQNACRNADRFRWIEPRTLPLLQFVQKVAVFGVMTYLIMSTWHINLTGWLASAGVAGIAVGFAAKDTLANFISGVFILMDAPYAVGQYIIIDGVTRGEVTDIGLRSTRLLTRGNIEVTVPNAVIANAKIINESSGPSTTMRVEVEVGVAYGSDIDQVRALLDRCATGVPNTVPSDQARVRFTHMGDSGLIFQVRVFIEDPRFRGRVVDALNTRIYKALREAGVEIPFPQRDLWIRQWPAGRNQASPEDAPPPVSSS